MVQHLPNKYKVPGSIPKVGREEHKGKGRGNGRGEGEKEKGSGGQEKGETGKKRGSLLTSNTLLLRIWHLKQGRKWRQA